MQPQPTPAFEVEFKRVYAAENPNSKEDSWKKKKKLMWLYSDTV